MAIHWLTKNNQLNKNMEDHTTYRYFKELSQTFLLKRVVKDKTIDV